MFVLFLVAVVKISIAGTLGLFQNTPRIGQRKGQGVVFLGQLPKQRNLDFWGQEAM